MKNGKHGHMMGGKFVANFEKSSNWIRLVRDRTLWQNTVRKLIQGCTSFRSQAARANKFLTVAPNICGSSVWNLPHVAPAVMNPQVPPKKGEIARVTKNKDLLKDESHSWDFFHSDIGFWQYQAWLNEGNFEFTYMDFRTRTQYYVL
jgi:hypothetical protein